MSKAVPRPRLLVLAEHRQRGPEPVFSFPFLVVVPVCDRLRMVLIVTTLIAIVSRELALFLAFFLKSCIDKALTVAQRFVKIFVYKL